MASYLPNLQTTNISMWTIPAFWILSLLPRNYGQSLYKRATNKKFDSRAPREFVKTVQTDAALDSATRARILRAEAAVLNGFENFGVFCAAMAAGNAARLDAGLMNGLALAYLVSRAVYSVVYINNDTEGLAAVRGMAYGGGMLILFTTFIKAGSAFARMG